MRRNSRELISVIAIATSLNMLPPGPVLAQQPLLEPTPDRYEPNDTKPTATPINLGDTLTANLVSTNPTINDKDFYTVNTSAGAVSPQLSIQSPDGINHISVTDFGCTEPTEINKAPIYNNDTVIFPIQGAGECKVKLSNFDGYTKTYQISYTDPGLQPEIQPTGFEKDQKRIMAPGELVTATWQITNTSQGPITGTLNIQYDPDIITSTAQSAVITLPISSTDYISIPLTTLQNLPVGTNLPITISFSSNESGITTTFAQEAKYKGPQIDKVVTFSGSNRQARFASVMDEVNKRVIVDLENLGVNSKDVYQLTSNPNYIVNNVIQEPVTGDTDYSDRLDKYIQENTKESPLNVLLYFISHGHDDGQNSKVCIINTDESCDTDADALADTELVNKIRQLNQKYGTTISIALDNCNSKSLLKKLLQLNQESDKPIVIFIISAGYGTTSSAILDNNGNYTTFTTKMLESVTSKDTQAAFEDSHAYFGGTQAISNGTDLHSSNICFTSNTAVKDAAFYLGTNYIPVTPEPDKTGCLVLLPLTVR